VNREGVNAEPGAEKCGCDSEPGLKGEQDKSTESSSILNPDADETLFPRKMKASRSEKDLSDMDEVSDLGFTSYSTFAYICIRHKHLHMFMCKLLL
jgi:hypothetical protein